MMEKLPYPSGIHFRSGSRFPLHKIEAESLAPGRVLRRTGIGQKYKKQE
jgi:hypothetical protein